jgi:ATP-dependent helicase/nuclease subunit B
LTDLLASHRRFVGWLAADAEGDTSELWAREAGSAASTFWDELELAAPALDRVPVSAYPALLAVLMGTVQVRPRRGAHPRVAILGQLESRLAHADLVLLGGLTEGTWPAPIDAGPWLNRRMRRELGLPPVEQAIGIGAADFVAQAAAPEVVLSWSRKDAVGTPRTASRWVQRLVAVSKAARLEEAIQAEPCWRDWAQALDRPAGPPRPCEQPAPRPPLAARPRELSATDIEKLLRNPYGLYARRILRLAALDELDADPGGAERGQIIHEALRRFVDAYPAALPDDPQRELERIGHELFRAIADQPQVLTIWWPRFRSTAAWFVERERERRAALKHIAAELDGQLVIGDGDGAFKIRARADRIEVGRDGALTILDYKTGRPPDNGQVARGLAPQLPIEALIAVGGGFTGIAPSEQIDLLYWHLSGGHSGGSEQRAGGARLDAQELLARARVGLQRLLAHFANPASAYVAVPRPEVAPAFDDYEHLSRIAEWRGWSGS